MKNIRKLWRYILPGMIATVLIALLIRGFCVEYMHTVERDTLNASLEQSNLDLGKARSQIVSLTQLKSLLEKETAKEIKSKNEALQEVARLEGLLNSSGQGKIKIKYVIREKIVEKVKTVYVKGKDGELLEVTEAPFSYQDFRITIAGDAIQETLEYKLHQKFRGHITRTILAGRSIYYFKLYELNPEGKDVSELELTDLKVFEVEKSDKSWRFNPHIDIGLTGGMKFEPIDWNGVADIGVSFFSYGRTEVDNDFRFLRLSVGITEDNGAVGLTPVSWNMAQYLPLFSDLYLSLTVHWLFPDNRWAVGLGISSTL